MDVRRVPIESVQEDPNNARSHGEVNIAAIENSLKEFGQVEPLVVHKSTQRIIGGNARLSVMRKLGWKLIDVVEIDLPDIKASALGIALNRSGELAEWNTQNLETLLTDLKLKDFDIKSLGWNDKELEELFKPKEIEGNTDPDVIPEVKESKVKSGEMYKLGNHRLICGDATQKDDIDKLIGYKKADICFTSPPYNLGKSATLHGNKKLKDSKYINNQSDDMNGEEWLSLINTSLIIARQFTKYQFYNIQQLAGNKTQVIELQYQHKDYFADIAIWNKQHGAPAMAENVMNVQFEYVFIFSSKKNPSRAITTASFRGTVPNVYNGNPQRNNQFSDSHAATFPVDFPLHFIESFTPNNGIVYDPFCGTGTTVIACEKISRTCYAVEINPHYCDIIIKRWEDFTGKKSELLK